MRILALETSNNETSVALLEAGCLVRESRLSSERRVAQALVPSIQDELTLAGWKSSDVQLVAVSQGPGSFTGLRVGITTAKTLAYVLQVPVIGVNTLEVIAFQAYYPLDAADQGPFVESGRPLAVVMNAHRGQFFAAEFTVLAGQQCKTVEPTHLVTQEQWVQQLEPGLVLSGPGLSLVEDSLPSTVLAIEASRRLPRAAAVARLVQAKLPSVTLPTADLNHQIFSLCPEYYRHSAAEEKRLASPDT
ncbi:MAG: tRNA (adenosine(37)-N6)-threonylcarbamoyltransferase complex dimerization subunit type 1 TsaB [Pirellulaceae bacterium]